MSLDSCTDCGHIVDTDDDTEFYDLSHKNPNGFGGHCTPCRDEILDGMTEAELAEHEVRVYGGAAKTA